MVPTGAILRGQQGVSIGGKTLALQLGGGSGGARRCAAIAEDWGYDEVNLNVGCPSDRVQNAASAPA